MEADTHRYTHWQTDSSLDNVAICLNLEANTDNMTTVYTVHASATASATELFETAPET